MLIARYQMLALISCFTVFVIFAYLSDHPRFRYRGNSCLYSIIYEQTGPVYMASIGGSRMMTDLEPNGLSDLFAKELGYQPTIYNLAQPWQSSDISYVVLRDFMEQRSVRHLVVVADRYHHGVYHPELFRFMKTRDLIDIFFSRPSQPILERLSSTLHMWARKLAELYEIYIILKPTTVTSARPSTCYEKDHPINLPALQKAKREHAEIGETLANWKINDIEYEHSTYFDRKIVELAKRYGATVTFIHLPRLNDLSISDSTIAKFESIVGAKLIQVPQEIRERLDDGYRDGSHLYEAGRKVFLPWLAQELPPSPKSKTINPAQ